MGAGGRKVNSSTNVTGMRFRRGQTSAFKDGQVVGGQGSPFKFGGGTPGSSGSNPGFNRMSTFGTAGRFDLSNQNKKKSSSPLGLKTSKTMIGGKKGGFEDQSKNLQIKDFNKTLKEVDKIKEENESSELSEDFSSLSKTGRNTGRGS